MKEKLNMKKGHDAASKVADSPSTGQYDFKHPCYLRIHHFPSATSTNTAFTIPKSKLCLFVSSTFTDTHRERNLLHEVILPSLQGEYQSTAVELLFSDMRFGVKDENTLDHMTWISCAEEILRCYEESHQDTCYFLSLQSEKYGYMPIPKFVSRQDLDSRVQQKEEDVKNLQTRLSKATEDTTSVNEEEMQIMQRELVQLQQVLRLVREWYQLDENHIQTASSANPQNTIGRYELKRLESMNDGTFWNEALPILREHLLNDLSFDTDRFDELVIGRSVTEWETLYAMHLSSQRCYWINRHLEKSDFKDPSDSSKGRYFHLCDTTCNPSMRLKLETLLMKMKSNLLPLQKVFYLPSESATLLPTHYEEDNEESKKYLKDWEAHVRSTVTENLEIIRKDKESWQLNGKAFGISGSLLEDMLIHIEWYEKKVTTFTGREELLQRCVHNLFPSDDTLAKKKTPFAAISLSLIGKSGSGKTALMSKLIQFVAQKTSTLAVDAAAIPPPNIVRFCGISTHSKEAYDLIRSIALQITLHYQQHAEIEEVLSLWKLPSSTTAYEKAVKCFHRLMLSYPVLLFLDSLDQLSNTYEARSRLSFLHGIECHPQGKIVVSTLPDEYDEEHKRWKYCYWCETRLKQAEVPRVDVTSLFENDANQQAKELVTSLLLQRHRTLTVTQMQYVLAQAEVEPSILYFILSLEVVTKWKSFDQKLHLVPSVRGIANQLFEQLEADFGRQLTSYAIALITFAREGISDTEMHDLLSLSDTVLEEVFQYSKLSQVYRLPIHTWLRMKQAMKNLLIENTASGVSWYHRQLKEAAEERYASIRKDVLGILGKYFANCIAAELHSKRLIKEQPLTWHGKSVWDISTALNRRRVIEGYYHLLHAVCYEEAVNEMLSFDVICAVMLSGDAFQYHRSLSDLLAYSKHPDCIFAEDVKIRIRHYYQWIHRDITRIQNSPRDIIALSASSEPLTSRVRTDGELAFFCSDPNSTSSPNWFQLARSWKTSSADSSVIMGRLIGGEEDFGPLLSTFTGHSQDLTSSAWSPSSQLLLTGSKDKTVRVWDISSGESIRIFDGHTSSVTSVAWNVDETLAASGGEDETVFIWDIARGQMLTTLQYHKDEVTCLQWTKDGSKLASGGRDFQIHIYCGNTFALLKTFKSPHGIVNCLAWSLDGTKIAIGSWGGRLAICDYNTEEEVRVFQGPRDNFSCIVWTDHTNQRLVSGSDDGSIKIWNLHAKLIPEEERDFEKGEAEHLHRIHKGDIMSIAYSPTSGLLATSSRDKTAKIFDFNALLIAANPLTTLSAHSSDVNTVSWDASGTLLASGGGTDRTINLWNLSAFINTSTNDSSNKMKEVTYNGIQGVDWNVSNSTLFVAKGTDYIYQYDSNTYLEIGTILPVADEEPTAKTTVETTKAPKPFPAIRAVAVSPNGDKFVIGAWNGNLGICDTASGKVLLQIDRFRGTVSNLSWSHDGKFIIGEDSSNVKIFDAVSGAIVQVIKPPRFSSSNTQSIAASLAYLATSTYHGEICIFPLNLHGNDSHHKKKDKATPKKDNEDSDVLLLIPHKDKFAGGHKKGINSTSWGHHDKWLASASSDLTVKIWALNHLDHHNAKHPPSFELLHTLQAHTEMVSVVKWLSPDSDILASGSNDTTIKLWNGKDGSLIKSLQGHRNAVNILLWKPNAENGTSLLSGSKDGSLICWNEYALGH